MASRSNPGLPPSSIASFLEANESLDIALLAEFDDTYTNAAYGTPHDDLRGINFEGIATISELLAQILHDLASASKSKLEVIFCHAQVN